MEKSDVLLDQPFDSQMLLFPSLSSEKRTYIGILDIMNFPSPDQSGDLVLLPPLDRRGITGSEVEMIARKHPYAQPDRPTCRKVEYQE